MNFRTPLFSIYLKPVYAWANAITEQGSTLEIGCIVGTESLKHDVLILKSLTHNQLTKLLPHVEHYKTTFFNQYLTATEEYKKFSKNESLARRWQETIGNKKKKADYMQASLDFIKKRLEKTDEKMKTLEEYQLLINA